MVDEILAVGDVNFQQKCLNKMRELQNAGITVVLVSHSMQQIADTCDRAIWIQDGYVMAIGETGKVIQQYMDFMEGRNKQNRVEAQKREIECDGEITQSEMLVNGCVSPEHRIMSGDDTGFRPHYKGKELRKVLVNIEVVSEKFIMCFTKNFDNEGNFFQVQEGNFTIELGSLPFYPGKYYINLRIVGEDGARIVEEAPLLDFSVNDEEIGQESGAVRLQASCVCDAI